MIIQYIKRIKQEVSPKKKSKMKRTHKVGVLVAFNKDGKPRVGWSLTNVNNGDAFDKQEGIRLATERAISPIVLHDEKAALMYTPKSIQEDLKAFLERSKKYLKY